MINTRHSSVPFTHAHYSSLSIRNQARENKRLQPGGGARRRGTETPELCFHRAHQHQHQLLRQNCQGKSVAKMPAEEVSPPDASPQNPSINDVVVAAGFTVGKSPTVSRPPPPPPPPPVSRSSPAAKRSSSLSAEVSRKKKVPKYTYVGLGDLTAGSVVNVYGVVVFFKQPLKITDQSNEKISCSVFCEKLEDHPKIYQIGDIVRLHRVQLFNSSMTLVKTFGFSVMAFDGAVGGSMEPRTSSRSFSFDQEDRRRVEELRSWASDQSLLPPSPTMPLCDVWDGTRSAHTLLKVIVEPDATEGPSSFPRRERGSSQTSSSTTTTWRSSKVPGLTSSQKELDHLAFHLHGGNAFGRGIRACPEDDEDDFSDLNDSELMEIWSTPPESIAAEKQRSNGAVHQLFSPRDDIRNPSPLRAQIPESAQGEERRCDHDTHSVSLSEVKRSGPAGVHHVRVQLRSYEPQRLHQSLKLYCSKQEVPDDEMLAGLFSEASRDSGPFSPPPGRSLGRFLSGGNVSPLIRLPEHRPCEVVWRCERCSEAAVREPVCAGEGKILDEKIIAEALGVVPLRFVLLMKFELRDVSDSLHVFLWRNAYQGVDDDGLNQICYQISHSTFTRTSAPPNPNPA
ncbi:hypothetical protein F7725_015934 [Dissostichus mawsoni]|uniref:Telomeric single stranded DNA binding POT1/Cdc13 domain-containing protein n=1 Tax=Dissostichus mawsoni TaxID=36200 RepID=A0A7J5Y382_DISMA|nr:hypothetical protein F7725_015934 [Dissostichus mawsoni]